MTNSTITQDQLWQNLLESCSNWLDSRSRVQQLKIQPDPVEGGGYATLMREYASSLRELREALQEPKDQTEWDRVYALIRHWSQRAQAAEGALRMLDTALEAAWTAGELPASVLTGEQVRSYRAVLANVP